MRTPCTGIPGDSPLQPDLTDQARVELRRQSTIPLLIIETFVETIQCSRCGEDAPQLQKAPFRTELGERIQGQICQSCWQDWLEHQTLLINHYGLDPRDAKAREFLYAQIEQVLLGGGDAKQVDQSQQGAIEW